MLYDIMCIRDGVCLHSWNKRVFFSKLEFNALVMLNYRSKGINTSSSNRCVVGLEGIYCLFDFPFFWSSACEGIVCYKSLVVMVNLWDAATGCVFVVHACI